jgi:hypothetical protein
LEVKSRTRSLIGKERERERRGKDGRFFDANVFSSFSERDERVSRTTTTTTTATTTTRRRRRRCGGRKKSHHCQLFEKQHLGELDVGRGGDGEKNVAGGESDGEEERTK